MKRLRILVDMDDVLADVRTRILEEFNVLNNENVSPEFFEGKDYYAYVNDPKFKSYRHILFEDGFFAKLGVKDNAQEVMQKLHEKHDVFIVSAAMEFPNSLIEKYYWLEKYFPFISWKNIILCGDKSPIVGDYLIDDHIRNLVNFKGTPLLFDALHNKLDTKYTRMLDWNHVESYFTENGYL